MVAVSSTWLAKFPQIWERGGASWSALLPGDGALFAGSPRAPVCLPVLHGVGQQIYQFVIKGNQ